MWAGKVKLLGQRSWEIAGGLNQLLLCQESYISIFVCLVSFVFPMGTPRFLCWHMDPLRGFLVYHDCPSEMKSPAKGQFSSGATSITLESAGVGVCGILPARFNIVRDSWALGSPPTPSFPTLVLTTIFRLLHKKGFFWPVMTWECLW